MEEYQFKSSDRGVAELAVCFKDPAVFTIQAVDVKDRTINGMSPLIVTDKASMVGYGTGFFLTGENSVFDFHSDTTIDLVAPKTHQAYSLDGVQTESIRNGMKSGPA